MEIIIVRHGETIENEQGILQGGRMQGTLSEQGIEQAKKLAIELKDKKIDRIYSSDLLRASKTAEIIAEFHPNTPIKLIKELKERDFGEFTGLKKSDLSIPKDKLVGDILNTIKGEKIEEVIKRVKTFFDSIKQKDKNRAVLIVGHNSINKILISLVLNKQLSEIKPQKNLELNILKI